MLTEPYLLVSIGYGVLCVSLLTDVKPKNIKILMKKSMIMIVLLCVFSYIYYVYVVVTELVTNLSCQQLPERGINCLNKGYA